MRLALGLGKSLESLYSLIKKCQWCSWEKWNFSQGITGRYGPKWRDHVVPCRQCRPSGCADGGLEVNDASISRLCRENAWRPHLFPKTLPETNLAGNQWWMVGVLRFPFGMLEFRNLVNREWREDSSAWTYCSLLMVWLRIIKCVQTKTMIPIQSVICILPRHISDWFSVACPCSLRTKPAEASPRRAHKRCGGHHQRQPWRNLS